METNIHISDITYKKNELTKGKIKQPLPMLASWEVLATVLSFYGFRNKVYNILQILSHASRSYVLSHHCSRLKTFLVRHRFDPHSDLPLFIETSDISPAYGSCDTMEYFHTRNKKFFVSAWNFKENSSLHMVAQDIANLWQIEKR